MTYRSRYPRGVSATEVLGGWAGIVSWDGPIADRPVGCGHVHPDIDDAFRCADNYRCAHPEDIFKHLFKGETDE